MYTLLSFFIQTCVRGGLGGDWRGSGYIDTAQGRVAVLILQTVTNEVTVQTEGAVAVMGAITPIFTRFTGFANIFIHM